MISQKESIKKTMSALHNNLLPENVACDHTAVVISFS